MAHVWFTLKSGPQIAKNWGLPMSTRQRQQTCIGSGHVTIDMSSRQNMHAC